MNKTANTGRTRNPDSLSTSGKGQHDDFVEAQNGSTTRNNAGKSFSMLFPRTTIILILLSLAVCEAACSKIFNGKSGEVVLRLSGSNTIGAKLAPALVEAYLKDIGASNIEKIKGSDPEEMTIRAVLPGESGVKTIEIKAHGSDTAVKALENAECDIGMLSRKLKGDEAKNLAKLGDLLAPGSENVIAMDGVAIIVNRSNKVQELTLKQIAQIFTGDITDWSDLKGKGGKINVYARDDKSGTFDTFKNLVLGKEKKLVSAAKRFEDSNELSDAVSKDENGIGFVGLPYIGNTASIAVYEEGTTPLKPAPATINRREYLLYRELYFYLPPKSSNKLAKDLIAFAKSDEGQTVVKDTGFVSQNISDTPTTTQEAKVVRKDIPAELAKIEEDYEEFPTRFYFGSGGDALDDKALDDFDRIVSFLQKRGTKEIVLVGFADNRGTDERNLELSISRAKAVEKEFLKVGVKPSTVTGFGKAAPIASNDKPEGQQKNRRVQIYYR